MDEMAVVTIVTLSATGLTRLARAGEGYGAGGWQIGFVGASWTGSIVLKKLTSPPGATAAYETVGYFTTNDGAAVAAGTAISAAANIIVQDVGSDLFADYTHTAGTVTITVGGASELIGADEGFLPVLNPAFTGALRSVTALATPSAYTVTTASLFASTVSGATLMGMGTTGDVTLKNRAGTTVAYVGPNTTAFTCVGTITAGAASFTTGAFSSTLAVTGTSTLTGIVGVGGAGNAGRGITVLIGTLTGVIQRGIYSVAVFSSAATTSGAALYAEVNTAAASFTMVSGVGLLVGAPVLGAASAITNTYGVYANNQGAPGVTNAYGVYILAQSGAATTNIGLYNAGTTTLVGAVTASATLAVTGLATFANTTATPAAGSAAASIRFGTTATLGIYYGSGAPTVTAGKGSLYIRSDGTGIGDRLYVNTDAGTTWTNFVSGA